MQNIEQQVNQIHADLRALKGVCKSSFGSAYYASAVYLSGTGQDTVFALEHDEQGTRGAYRTAKHVWRRALSPSSSAAALAQVNNIIGASPSAMFPKYHDCMHVPLFSDAGINDQNRALLQLVFNKGAMPKIQDVLSVSSLRYMMGRLKRNINPLLSVPKSKRDRTFRVHQPYAQNAIIISPDVNGFTDMSYARDPQTLQAFAQSFLYDYLDQFVDRYGLKVSRYQGDGSWFWLPVNGDDDYAIHTAMSAAKDIADGFDDFIQKYLPDYPHKGVKILVEKEELRTHYWNKKGDWVPKFELSDTVFTSMNKASKAMKYKDQSHILIGPNLYAGLRGQTDLYNLDIDDYRYAVFDR